MFAPLVRIPNFREYVDNWRIFRLLCTQRVLYVKYAYILCKQSRIHGLTRIALLWLTGACVWVPLCACASPTNRALGPENFTNSAACLPAACWLLAVGCWLLVSHMCDVTAALTGFRQTAAGEIHRQAGHNARINTESGQQQVLHAWLT